jgi:hypothetical protein
MTSQVLVANLNGIALASDTLVTMTGPGGVRTFSGYSKVFSLGDQHRVAIMHSGNAELNDIPIQNLLANWASTLSSPLNTVSEYATSFLSWVDNTQAESHMLDEQTLELTLLRGEFESWKNFLESNLGDEDGGTIQDFEELLKLLGTTEEGIGFYSGLSPELVRRHVESNYGEILNEWLSELDSFPEITPELQEKLSIYMINALLQMRQDFNSSLATLVFAGFGKTQMAPEVVRFSTYGVFMGRLRTQGFVDSLNGPDTFHVDAEGMEDDFANFNLSGDEPSLLFSFAQDSSIQGFVSGISPDFIENVLSDQLAHEVGVGLRKLDIGKTRIDIVSLASQVSHHITEYAAELSRGRWQTMLGTLSAMTISGLSNIAESLVRLQSLAKYTQPTLTTVGDTIEVFTIDKLSGVKQVS